MRLTKHVALAGILLAVAAEGCTHLLAIDGDYADQPTGGSAGADASSEDTGIAGSAGIANGGSAGTANGGSAGTANGGSSGQGGSAGSGGSSGTGGQAGTSGQGGSTGTGGAGGTGGTAGTAGTGGSGGADAGPPVFCSSSTTLDDLVACILTGMPKADSNGFVVPGSQQLSDWRSMVTSMLQGACDFTAPASLSAIMTVRTFHDAGNGKDYCAAWEILDANTDGRVDHGWGTFVVNSAATQQLFHAAPHPLTDLSTEAQATALFKATNAKGLILAGAARSANSAASTCQSSYGQADVAHNSATTFQAANEALLAHYGAQPWHAIQWHGMAASTCASEVFLTHGVNTPPAPGDKLSLLKSAMASHHSGWCIEVPGTTCTAGSPCDQVSTTNVQGRLLNGVSASSVCSQAAASYSGRFIAIEQDPNFRNAQDWIASVNEVWP